MPYHFETIDSTQTFLKKLAQTESSLNHLEHAIADTQTAGIGRQGRSWISESGNLFLSVYLREFSLPITWVPHWIGVALVQALTTLQIPASHLKLKWPNDLIVDETRKAGGIICEKVGDGVIAGIGVNLLSAPEISDRETANIRALAPNVDFFQFHLKLCDALLDRLRKEPELAKLKTEYAHYSLLQPNQPIQWLDLQTQQTGDGIFLRYGEYGELIISESGHERPLYSEEVKLKIS